MSEKEEHGGSAFPAPIPNISRGMSLRDWFAGQAMQGMMARDSYDPGQATPQQRAALAFIEADAMLAERQKP